MRSALFLAIFLKRDFTQVLNEIHEKGIIPDEIKNGIITLVHKKNKKEDLRNYRPISLLNTDLKIYTKILANRLKPLLQKILQSYQFAAPGKTITDATTLLRDLHDYVASRNLNAFFISLDFEKAFDSVNHEWLYTVLKKINFPNSFLKIVESLYTNATSKILLMFLYAFEESVDCPLLSSFCDDSNLHISIQVCTFHDWCKQGIDQHIFNRKSDST